MKEQCSECKFWSVFPVDAQAEFKRGTCRRMPPVMDLLAIHQETFDYEANGENLADETAHCPYVVAAKHLEGYVVR